MNTGASRSPLRLANTTPIEDLNKIRRKISRPGLINLLNRINFRDGDITVHFSHNKYNHVITIQAKPQICNNDYLRCLWSEHEALPRETFLAALSHLAVHYEQEEIPALLYPKPYVDGAEIAYDKVYALTVLNPEFISPYLMVMKSLTMPRDKKISRVS